MSMSILEAFYGRVNSLILAPYKDIEFRIAKINPVWMKCGYEEKIKMRHGVSYTVEVAGHSTKVQIDTKRCFFDEIQINNFSHDNDFLHLQIKELDKVNKMDSL